MTETPADPIRLEYQLTEADVRHYCTCGRLGKLVGAVRGRVVGLLWLLSLGCFLVGLCFHAHGVRSGSLALGTTLIVILGLTWAREARGERRVCRVARLMGIPRKIGLVVSPEGISEAMESSFTFAWSEVIRLARMDHLTVIRLRPAGAVLIIPDRAFSSDRERVEFENALRAFIDRAAIPERAPVG